ncbi:MAG: type II toxin-antitoxin system RelE/ParE family toxin [Sphingobacteriaceae bacterium]|nr:type II toxin-antitoxin system RelE/ParE family toxin [Cytophagaceae bacterium]
MEESPKKITWSNPAKDRLLEIFEFWESLAGFEKADAMTDAFVARTRILERFPEIGTIDQKASSRAVTIRYLVEGYYRISYPYEQEERLVKIRDVFDTRQDSDTYYNS